MKAVVLTTIGLAALSGGFVSGQEPARSESVPIFHVTVVENTISAINYQYRQGPTTIDFKGTVLMPEAKGNAMKSGIRSADARRSMPALNTCFKPSGSVRNTSRTRFGP